MRMTMRFLAAAMLLLAAAGGGAATAADDSGGARLTGKLLVADTSMSDPRFAEAVIYVARHDELGAFGLIINKPLTKLPLAKLLSQLNVEDAATNAELELYFGGPVEEDLGFVLHSPEFAVKGATLTIEGGLAVSGVRQVLRAIGEHNGPEKALFVIGYAGWGADQLEQELERGDWIVIDADDKLVFDTPVAEKWRAAYERRALDL